MSDLRGRLQSLFAPAHRFSNFGEVISRVSIDQFRCHAATHLEVNSPVTALSGLNGTGKSTILQLLATAYRDPLQGVWNISDFFSINAIDTAPFTTHSRILFRFSTAVAGHERNLTISRSAHSSRWQGYTRRTRRSVFLAGAACYTPLNEQPSYVHRSRQFNIAATAQVSARTKQWVETILGSAYTSVEDHSLSAFSRRGNKIASVTRGATRYAEPNMGFGEARMIHIIKTLEALPERSLIILEEPETSLHPSAQYQFGRFLVDVAVEKRHQVFLSTHSEYLLTALPDASRMYLKREATGVTIIPGLSASQANSLMTGGVRPALVVLVEDNVAQAILTEVLRDNDPDFLGSISIVIGGDVDVLRKTMQGLKNTGLNVAAVLDGDMNAVPHENLFKLPGTLPPEKEIFASATFTSWLERRYRTRLQDFQTQLSGIDHHQWLGKLATHVRANSDAMVSEAARAYVDGLSVADKSNLQTALRSALRT